MMKCQKEQQERLLTSKHRCCIARRLLTRLTLQHKHTVELCVCTQHTIQEAQVDQTPQVDTTHVCCCHLVHYSQYTVHGWRVLTP
jgi:hypothetical protein